MQEVGCCFELGSGCSQVEQMRTFVVEIIGAP